MSLEQLERWIERLEPSPRIDGVSMLDGYLTAIIVGPCSIDPNEWMRHVLGPHSAIGMEGSEQLAAMQAIAARFNAIGESLATAPRDYAPIFERTDDGVVDAGSVQKVGVTPPLPVVGLGLRPAQTGGRTLNRASRCRPHSAPGAGDRPLVATSASAATCSCAG
jgi:Uncharacterised protein family (UPF0149)